MNTGRRETAEEKIADIKANPDRHRHDFDELTACCMVNGALDVSVMDAHSAYVDMGSNGGTRCDVTSGPCACGAWHDPKDKTVRVLDLKTKQVSNVPVRELSTGMIRAQVPDFGIVWVDARQLHHVRQHETLPPELEERARKLFRAFQGAFQGGFAKHYKCEQDWVDGFKNDAHPDSEIACFERLLPLYEEAIAGSDDNDLMEDAYALLVSCTTSSNAAEVFSTVRLHALPRAAAEALVRKFYGRGHG